MNTLRPLRIVRVSAVVAAITMTILGAGCSSRTPRQSATSGMTSTASTALTSIVRAPSIDLNGNRLDIPADDAGQALPQNPSARLAPGNPAYLTAPPAGLVWQRIWGGAASPVSTSDGPDRIENGIAAGFADTPQGAALAACDALARAIAAPEGMWQSIIRERFLGGGQALLDRIARSRAGTSRPAQYVAVPEGVRVQAGYRPDFAVVQIAVTTRDGWGYSTWPMAWSAQDWRVRVPDDLETLWSPAIPVADLATFGQWKAGS